MAFTLLNEVNADTTPADADCYLSDGGCKSLLIDAVSFGGGKVTIEVKRLNGQWVTPTLPDGSLAEFTANALEKFDYVGQGLIVRAKLTGATAPSKVNVFLS